MGPRCCAGRSGSWRGRRAARLWSSAPLARTSRSCRKAPWWPMTRAKARARCRASPPGWPRSAGAPRSRSSAPPTCRSCTRRSSGGCWTSRPRVWARARMWCCRSPAFLLPYAAARASCGVAMFPSSSSHGAAFPAAVPAILFTRYEAGSRAGSPVTLAVRGSEEDRVARRERGEHRVTFQRGLIQRLHPALPEQERGPQPVLDDQALGRLPGRAAALGGLSCSCFCARCCGP